MVIVYIYKTYEIALKQHYTHTTVLLLLWVERARVYKSLYEVSSARSNGPIYTYSFLTGLYVYSRLSTYMCIYMYVRVNINSHITVGCVCFVEVFGVLFTGARP